MKLLAAASILLAALPAVTPAACPATPPKYEACGGMIVNANRCAKGYTCMSDPRTGRCGLECDALGICVPDAAPRCGGFAGFSCPTDGKMKYQCFDDPRDDCDPKRGCADNMGICI